MAEFKLGRIRFVWKSDWAASTAYYVDDVVKNGGQVYICTAGHTANSDFYTDLTATRWELLSTGQDWKGTWTTSTYYKVNDLVKYGGSIYVCGTGHTSAATEALGLEANSGNWTTFAEGFDWKSNWATSTRYKKNDLVKYGGYTYVCNTGHTSAATSSSGLENDQASWTAFNAGLSYSQTWTAATKYNLNEVVKYGAGLWICTTNHTSTSSFDTGSFTQLVEGLSYESTWSNVTTYQPGDIVAYGGNQYVAKTVNSGATPSTSTANWDLFSKGFALQGDWSAVTAYKIGEVVRLNGYTYVASADNTNSEPPSGNWSRLNSGISWKGEWTNSTAYKLGDAVRFNASTYICILAHTSDDDDSTSTPTLNSPEKDVTGTYWNALTLGNETSVLTTVGDMVYYSGSGPSRLPVGTSGQVLQVSTDGVPEWAYLWQSDHVYYVAPHGVDAPYPEQGATLQSPWSSIRYACEQVEKGPRNPNAQYLLEMNRAFIQREVTEWIDRQIATNTAPFTTSFDYDEYKCERDTGYLIDRLIHDLGHGGNLKMRAAAQAYVNALGEGPHSIDEEDLPYTRLSAEAANDVAAFNYMLTVVGNVLSNTAPTVNYQTLNGDNSTAIVAQFIDTDYTTETGVMATVTDLVGIVTTVLTDQSTINLPARYAPNNLIHVKTGVYNETLPIIVPAETCILGDEVRAVTAGPAGSLVNISDAKYSIGAIGRLETVLGQIILGTDVTESSGNTATQSRAWPYASATEVTSIQQLVRTMQHSIDFRLGTTALVTNTDPTGYNSSFLSGYGDARTLLKENKKFLQEEIIAYITVNYPLVKYSKTACRRDVGYVVDAMIYDLTYGGSTQSLVAGLAYFDGAGSTSMINSAETAATIASYNRLKSVMQQVAVNTTVTRSTGNTVTQWTDSVRSSGSSASSFIGANIDIISAILAGGATTYRPNLTVTSITGADTLNTTAGHGLAAGDLIIPRTTAYGLTADVRYYVIASGLTGTAFKVSTSYAGSAVGSLTNGTGLTYVVDYEDRPTVTNGVTTTTALITAYTTLSAAVDTIVTNMSSYITANYPTLSYNTTKCQRDARIILDAVGYDFMFNSNFQSLKAAYAYLRSSASDVFANNQKAATRAAFSYVKTQAKSNVGGDTTAQARIETLMTLIDDIIFGATNEGSVCQTEIRAADYACLQLERNRDYIVAEISAYIGATYKSTVSATAVTTNYITVSSTSWMQRNAAIRFTGTIPSGAGISANTTYYVQNVVDSTTITIATTRDSNTALTLASASGSWTVALHYNSELCLRDVGTYIDAIKYDTKWPGNYKSLLAARYYANAVKGSYEEDMYYLRNGTGIRNQTLTGLSGDLTSTNSYGTSRVTAGAYISLDPGWGPDDFRTWITSRSPYVQNNATFGTAAIGQKIDGALHNGGNRSIVSNDFTQLISDGIGAWVTNNGRAELVSVFTYYSHIGYLAEAGGRIRGTNGNNSYGDFGSVAEGFDATEIPNTAVVDNHAYNATVGEVDTDGSDDIFAFEFDNAGSDYTEATWTISGAGLNADVEQDEFRDGAVFNIRLLDNVDDSTSAPEADGNFGGFGYLSNANTAQGGTTTQITLAATDSEISSAYTGMRIYLTDGTGVGQYGYINSYNSGTKIAAVYSEQTGSAGWDHIVPGTTIVAPDASTTYVIEPRVTFSAPGYTSTAATLPTSGAWTAAMFGATTTTASGLTGTYSGSGSGATWNVQRNGAKYYVTKALSGTGYTRLQTVTIDGTSVGGVTTTNDITITITSVNSVTGAIQDFEYAGTGMVGRYVAVRSGSQVGATSENGVDWTTRATLMPSGASWTDIAYGMFADGSSNEKVSMFVAVAGGSANTTGAYSLDGITWAASTMPASATWVAVTYGEGKFVAIASDSTTVGISNDGITWDVTGTLTATGFTDITYGKGLFVAVKSGTAVAAVSTDGIAWSATTLPSSSNWNAVAYGNNRFVAVSNTSGAVAAYSLDGTNWVASTLPATASWTDITYGQGVFLAVSGSTQAATSENGVVWTTRTMSTAANGFSHATFGNPQRVPTFVAVGGGTGTVASYVKTGATAKARAYIAQEKIFAIRLIEPGSGYTSAPTMTITDPNNIYEAPSTVRIGNGALATPSFKNRGTGFSSASAEILTGDGFADFFQDGSYIAVKRLTARPVAGSNIVFGHLPNETFKLVNVLTFLGNFDGSYTCYFQVSPQMKKINAPAHHETATTRIRYSQVRLTGHDFLNIGTGNFSESNYPNTPLQDPVQANETVENNGGRVFFTSTDQDGNFRVGDLFTIEQSTGVATLNADAFNIAGLQELSLGEVTLGGGSATITEFSTDPYFTANSDSIIPTQRAIKAYISSQIGGGGASINVNSVTAGSVYIATNTITTTTGSVINVSAKVNFTGGITGIPIALNYFLT